MRIARFSTGGDPAFGIVELAADGGKHPDTISTLTGDPISMPVQFSGSGTSWRPSGCSRRSSRGARWSASAATTPLTPPSSATRCRPAAALLQAQHLGDRARRAIIYPEPVHEMAYEGELAMVIGRICRDVPPSGWTR